MYILGRLAINIIALVWIDFELKKLAYSEKYQTILGKH